MRKLLVSFTMLGTLAVVAAVFTPGAVSASQTNCPSGGTPAAGSTVKGGLEVDGACVLDNVTVKGGVTVDAGAGLGFSGGAIKGGIDVTP
jgi:hypothetical protein